MALKDIIKYKTTAGTPASADIPNGGMVTSKTEKRVYAKADDTLVPLANKSEVDSLTLAIRQTYILNLIGV